MNFSEEKGFTLIELLVSLAIGGITLASVYANLVNAMKLNNDQHLKSEAEYRAQAILDYITDDIRMAGAGMPIGQANFALNDVSLGDAPLPILATSDDDELYLKLNEDGRVAIVTTSYTPAPASLSIEVDDASGIEIGNTIYLSNSTTGGEDGLMGEISGVSGNTITILSSYTSSAGASFDVGSTLNVVSNVNYDGTQSELGFYRNNLTLSPNTELDLDYLDVDGNEITLPLTNSAVANLLNRIHITVTVESEFPIRTGNGQPHVAIAEQVVVLRNLVINQNP